MGQWILTPPWNLVGFPATSVPVARSRERLPLAVQLVAPPEREELILAVAQQLGALMPFPRWTEARWAERGSRHPTARPGVPAGRAAGHSIAAGAKPGALAHIAPRAARAKDLPMRHGQDVVEAFQFTVGIDPHSAERVARERGGRGDVQVLVRTAGPGWLRVQLVSGAPRRGSMLFLPGRGLFAVTRRDEWRVGEDERRVLLMLRTVSEAVPDVEAARR